MSCALCVIGSQLDDAVDADAAPSVQSTSWLLLTPTIEDQTAQMLAASANARAPPVS
ncbi:MAG: hypothetical protein AAGD92_07315 [Pseudomonadota bacterium]